MDEIKELSVDEAKQLLDKGEALFVDVRDLGSYESGHIKGSLHLSNETLTEFLNSADKSRQTILYCFHGNASRGGVQYLGAQGFSDVYSLTGGYTAWESTFGEVFSEK